MVKVALLIGVSKYESDLTPLLAATKDVEAIQPILEDPEIGGFDEVKNLINPDRQAMEEAIFSLFANRNKDDLLLLFFSGHGIKDDIGELYLATCNTRKEQGKLVHPTAVAASFVRSRMDDMNCRSKRQVLILDCCFSGAFSQGMKVKDDGSLPINQQLGGEGRAILTSSTSTQYSFEHPGFELSLYTHFLIEGLKTGVADLDSDGNISVDELHTYVSDKVQETVPGKMKPEIYPVKEGYKIILAKVHVGDPKLEYRKIVERYLRNGRFSISARKLIDIKQDNLGISLKEAKTIENEVLKPYLEYAAKLKKYKEILAELIKDVHSGNDLILNDFKEIQQAFGLREEDAVKIQQEIISNQEAEFLIRFANSILEQINSNQKLIKSKDEYPPCIAYRLNQPQRGDQLYQLVLIQQINGLYIYVNKDILKNSLLTIKSLYECYMGEGVVTEGIFFVLPSKYDIFLDSLYPVYADLFKGKIQGSFSLNELTQNEDGDYEYTKQKFSLIEFPVNKMSNRSDSYLVVSDNKTFTNTWEICIRSREVLEEVINYLCQQMTVQGLLRPLSSPPAATENPSATASSLTEM